MKPQAKGECRDYTTTRCSWCEDYVLREARYVDDVGSCRLFLYLGIGVSEYGFILIKEEESWMCVKKRI